MKYILGKKLEMSQIYNEKGEVVPVTVVEAGPCSVTQIRDDESGRKKIQIGHGFKKNVSKPLKGHLQGLGSFRLLREFFFQSGKEASKGQQIDVSIFKEGEKVDVSGVSKGKGYQGVVKRHGFHGSPASHGHKDQLRMPGSIGATNAARVFPGKKMPGRMGADNITVKNLEIVKIDPAKNLLMIKGALPGARNGVVIITSHEEWQVVEQLRENKQSAASSAYQESIGDVTDKKGESKEMEKIGAEGAAENK